MTTPQLAQLARDLFNAADRLHQQTLRRPNGHPHDETQAEHEMRRALERVAAAGHLLNTPPPEGPNQ